MGVLAAERIKLTSTRSPWWSAAIIVVLGLGFAALMGWVANQAIADPENSEGFPGLTPATAAGGVTGFGVMVLMIMAALVVTSEYRFGTLKTTFQAMPSRTKVIATKAGLVGVFGAVLTSVLAFGAIFVAGLIANTDAQAPLELSTGEQWRAVYGIPIYAFLCVVLAIGVGTLVKQSAAAISLVVLWPLLIESLVGLFGNVGEKITAFLPFANANHFMDENASSVDFHWGPWGSLIYFAVFVAVVFGAAIFVVNRRDA
ncbi:ABC transporter permease [Antrihabitans sp. YC2-6]|uniref:ABC transporter permease n=1 Tax=Antrihabitans sp. YC2-6 TaxID=2799498 RepID=UPI0018F3D4F0|nr:ABC transporter permease [Antrihabitans sp. YC2-6]MBJ8348565.1 ABC transporter permease [Antrihabitans sp. YC2-6]